MIRVILVEEQKVIREGLKILLESESDIKVVGSVSNANAALSKIENLNPDILLISMTLSEVEEFEVVKAIQQKDDRLKIIIFCNQVDASDFVQYLESGIKGCLLKDISVSEIKEVIHYINKGYTHIGNNIFQAVIPQLSDAISALQIVDSESNKTLEFQDSEVLSDDKFQFQPLGSRQNSHNNNHNNHKKINDYFTENKNPQSSIPIEGNLALGEPLPLSNTDQPNKDSWWKRGIAGLALLSLGLVAIATGLISYRQGSEIVIKDAVVKGKIVSIDSPIKGKLQEIIYLQGMNIEANQVLASIKPLEDNNAAKIISQLEKDIVLKQEQINNAKKFIAVLESNLKNFPKKSEISINIPQVPEGTKISIDNAREISNLEQQIVNQKVAINLLDKELTNLQETLTNTKANSVNNQIIPIKAPISGAVYKINYTAGELIPLGKEIATLIDCQNLWVEAIVESKVAAKINLHKDVSVQLEEQKSLIPGKINVIENLSDRDQITKPKSLDLDSTIPVNNNNNDDDNEESLSRVIINVDFSTSELMLQKFCNVGSTAKISINN